MEESVTEEETKSTEESTTEEESESMEESTTEEESESMEESTTEEESESMEESTTEEETESTEESTTEEETESTEESTTEEESKSTEEFTTEESTVEETTEEETTEIETETETETETTEMIAFADIEDVVTFNTGNMEISVIPRDDYSDDLFEVCLDENIFVQPFEADGSFTIEAEADAFFPYEVQFQYDGSTENKWFMNPDDSVDVSGHMFYIHSEFSGDVVTQMNLSVAGKTVTVYPEEKEFTNDGGISTYSLMPLEVRSLTVDLTGLNPLQLTRVAVSDVFAGENSISAEKIAWSREWHEDDYKVNSTGDALDLSYDTVDGGTSWEMIVGDADQLNLSNIRYQVTVNTNRTKNWLNPVVCKQNSDGSLTGNLVSVAEYGDDSWTGKNRWDWWRDEHIYLLENSITSEDSLFLKLDHATFGSDNVKVYEGMLNSPDEAGQATEITSEIFGGQGYELSYEYEYGGYIAYITLVNYANDNSTVTGFLPLYIVVRVENEYFNFIIEDMNGQYCGWGPFWTKDNREFQTYELYKGYSAEQQYYLSAEHFVNNSGTSGSSAGRGVTVFKGFYNTLEEAQNSNAEDITSDMFSDWSRGYLGNYSQGVDFTFFSNGRVFHYNVKVVEGNEERYVNSSLDFHVWGFNDADGNFVKAYGVDTDEDSYADYSYLTILVDKDVDLTNLALRFSTDDSKAKVYCEGSSSPEQSGESYHDFSKGMIQYTVSAGDGRNAANYWIQVVKPDTSNAKLYINSLADKDAKTEVRDGVTYTTREVMIDGVHDYVHDILIANMGNAPVSKIGVELDSDVVALDSYWTLSGNQDLGMFDSDKEISNLAKIRLKQKEGVPDGTEVTGTLKIQEDGKDLIVMTLTGTVGDPSITTTEIPSAIKYVPYGTMIQNSNKYDRNQFSYSLWSGTLPEGMALKPNGEIYGVPKESGTFHIEVELYNSMNGLRSSYKEFDLIVLDNTVENVENATDEGYELSTRLTKMESSSDFMVISEGVFSDFKDIYIDGDQLVKGVDYDAESGSTRITIRSETLSKKGSGVHTLGIEFREGGSDTGRLKRAAQNYNYDAESMSLVEMPSSSSSSSNSSSSSSSNNNSSNSNTATTAKAENTPIEVVPVEGFVYKEGYTILQTDMSQNNILRAALLNQYYGQNMYLNIVFAADFGLTIDMAGVPKAENDMEIAYTFTPDVTITSEFNVIHAIPNAIKPLGFEAIFNFHIGDAYIGKKVYIYVLNESGTGYDFAGETIVNEIGNIAFASRNVTDVIIFVEK